MYDELKRAIGTGKVVGFFGDKNFPNVKQGKRIKDKHEALARIQALLLALKPKKIYVCPEMGLSSNLLSLFSLLDIPYSIINPYQGYFDNIPKSQKLRLFLGLEQSEAIVTMQEGKPENLLEQQKLFKESQDFLVNNSEIIITAFGNNPDSEIEKTTNELMAGEKIVIAISYAT
jgi:hypothetical protein